LETVIGADVAVRQQYTALSGRIAQESSTLKGLEEKLQDAQGAAGRRKTLQTEREACCGFDWSGRRVISTTLAAPRVPSPETL